MLSCIEGDQITDDTSVEVVGETCRQANSAEVIRKSLLTGYIFMIENKNCVCDFKVNKNPHTYFSSSLRKKVAAKATPSLRNVVKLLGCRHSRD